MREENSGRRVASTPRCRTDHRSRPADDPARGGTIIMIGRGCTVGIGLEGKVSVGHHPPAPSCSAKPTPDKMKERREGLLRHRPQAADGGRLRRPPRRAARGDPMPPARKGRQSTTAKGPGYGFFKYFNHAWPGLWHGRHEWPYHGERTQQCSGGRAKAAEAAAGDGVQRRAGNRTSRAGEFGCARLEDDMHDHRKKRPPPELLVTPQSRSSIESHFLTFAFGFCVSSFGSDFSAISC